MARLKPCPFYARTELEVPWLQQRFSGCIRGFLAASDPGWTALAAEVVVAAGGVGAAEVVVDVADFVGEEVDFAAESLNLGLGAAVDIEVQFAAQAVFLILAVLAHHDDGGLNGGEHRQKKVEQDEGVGVPGLAVQGDQRDAEDDVTGHGGQEEDDEGPGAAEAGDVVGDAFAEGLAFVDELVGVAVGAAGDDALGGVDLAAEHGEHVEAGEGFAFEESGDVGAIDLEAGGGFGGDGGGLVGAAFEHGGEAEEVAVAGLGEDDFLAVLVDQSDLDGAGEGDVGRPVGVAGFVDALVGGELAELDLLAEDGELVGVEQGEDWDLAEFVDEGHRGSGS
jgi:hypothetical protein